VNKSQYVFPLACLALVSLLTGCKQSTTPTESSDASGPLKITCTIGMIGDAVREVGGEQVAVTALMGTGVDPHLYKASQGDLARLNEADVILYNGLHLEGRMADVLVGMASRVKTYQVTDQIDPAVLREPPEFQGNYDPHVWFDVSLWQKAAERIHAILVENRPAQKAYFDERAAAYQAKLAELHEYARTQIATIPENHRVLVTAHDAFGYFGRAYGMEVLGVQGISTSSEYGLQDLNKLVEMLVTRKIQAVFVETSISHASIEALIAGAASKGHTVRLGGTLYSDAMGEAGTPEGTYLGMVRHNVDTIVEALKSDASPG